MYIFSTCYIFEMEAPFTKDGPLDKWNMVIYHPN